MAEVTVMMYLDNVAGSEKNLHECIQDDEAMQRMFEEWLNKNITNWQDETEVAIASENKEETDG